MYLFPCITPSLLFVILLLIGSSCTKVKDYEQATWEERPEGKPCQSRPSSTIDFANPVEFFDKNHLYCITIEMDEEELEQMRYESRFGPNVLDQGGVSARKAAFEYFHQCDVAFPSYYNWYKADIEIDGEEAEEVGIRKKGFLGSIFSVAPSIKLDINRHSGGATQLQALQKMTLNNNAEDPSRMMQVLLYRFYEWANYPSPQANLANVSINGEALGVYSNVEPIDENFLLRAFGNNTGSLYECQLTDFRSNWVNRWESKTAATDRSKLQLMVIADALANVDDNNLVNALDAHLNIDNFIRFWALEIISNHIDGYCRNSNNAYLYFDPNDNGRGTFIPTGVNYFQSDDLQDVPMNEFATAELPRRLSKCPGIPQRLEAAINLLLQQAWQEQDLRQLINTFQVQVYTSQVEDQDEYSVAQHYVPTLRKWIDRRKSSLSIIIANQGMPIGASNPSKVCYFEE